MVKILGIESSCDDSAAAVLDSELGILSNIVINQDEAHKIYQGVVPEIASRSHMDNLEKAIERALEEAKCSLNEIDAVAATCGPGLIGGVLVGAMFGKSIASTLQKPFIAVNHLEGHALTARLSDKIEYPYLLLLVSGGHCQFVAVKDLADYKILGSTLDDSVGEAFDKVAKMLGLEFPGGPKIEQKAKAGDEHRFDFPKPIINQKNCDMSFSGLKTAVRLQIGKIITDKQKLDEQDICDIAASFQKTVSDILVSKSRRAILEYEHICDSKSLVISGGVASNCYIRESLQSLTNDLGYNFVAPPIKLCTDNAAMIAFAGLERYRAAKIDDVGFNPRARWSLEEL